ncbi:hypothetical protein LTR62_005527 [Meristemomyces frigidus]|uniref:Protein BIG1 n=1 Tax=Meristemomyces frigidus TaxID=1508187 RepID=A0AAN7TDP1_9PEZI|nr:hypothetical protein LTR62_005527 [Meristemomyces frigidus]
MLLPRTTITLLAAIVAANAFKDAHPLLVLSSDPLPQDLPGSRQVSTYSAVENSAHKPLSSCTWDHHIITTRMGLRAGDFESMPLVQARLRDARKQQIYQVAEVLGNGLAGLAEGVAEECATRKGRGVQYNPDDTPLSTAPEIRAAQLESVDKNVDSLLSAIVAKGESYVVMLAGVPEPRDNVEDRQHPPYEMDEPYPTGFHTDMKRDLSSNANSTSPQAHLPLFEKYKFLSPAIFMGLVVTLLLGLILYVGITAIAGLEVSYFAFSKEMGNQGQQQRNKQQ